MVLAPSGPQSESARAVAAGGDGARGTGGAAAAPSAPVGGEESSEASDTSDGPSDSYDPQFQPTLINAPGAAPRSINESAPDAEAAPASVATDSPDALPAAAASEEPAKASVFDSATIVEPTPVEMTSERSMTPEAAPRAAATAEEQDARRYTGDQSQRTAGVGSSSGGSRRKGAAQLEAGTVLYSRYEIVRRIGGGGMGAVYNAKDRNLGDAPRAVKEMVQSNIDESQHQKAINDFKRESMLLASLEHPSIPTIYDYFFDEGASRFYLVMKYISGGDFLARLRNAPGGRIDELTVTDWGMQVADVLDYLHNRRPPIIYRDLKPANLMIDGNSGRVMLIDFGIARWVAPQEKGVTAVGTMGYAPPELFSGKVEPRSDVYSLGATMFHLLTGSDPQDNPLLIFDFNKFPRPRQINPGLSNEIERILMRAVEYTPETRFRSAAELRDTLGQHLEKLRAGNVTYGGVASGAEAQDVKTVGVEMVYCGFCGGRIAAEDVFCAHCGARQPIAAASVRAAARATAKLVVAGTTELDATFQLQKDSILVGRTDPQSNIFPDIDLSKFDPETKISRRHARIWRQGETFLVEDLGSVNGTVINDAVKLGPRQPRTLEHGDRLRLGETTLHFMVG
jgi:serine/threonine-protein kinase